MKDNPVLLCLDRLKQLDDRSKHQSLDKNLEMDELLDTLTELCGAQGSGNAAIATRNGGVELVFSICSKIGVGCERTLVSALKAMAALLHGISLTVSNINAILICLRNKLNCYYNLFINSGLFLGHL